MEFVQNKKLQSLGSVNISVEELLKMNKKYL